MNSKAIFFDIDGTLWDENEIIPQSTVEAITELRRNGHYPVICSGRARRHIIDSKFDGIPFAGIIAALGEHVETEGEVIFERYLPEELAEKIVQLSFECGVPIVLEGPKNYWISPEGFKKDYFVDSLYKDLGKDAITISRESSGFKVNKFSGDILLKSDFKKFEKELGDKIHFVRHSWATDDEIKDDYSVIGGFEGVIPNNDKMRGIEIFCRKLNIDLSDTIAFGDSINDMEMILGVGIGVAMGNGVDSLKKVADYVTDNVADNGIYNALVHFGLI